MELIDNLAARSNQSEAGLVAVATSYPNEVVLNAVAQVNNALEQVVVWSAVNLTRNSEVGNHHVSAMEEDLEVVVVPTIAIGVGEGVLNLAHVACLASQSCKRSRVPAALAVRIDRLNANVILNTVLESIKSDGLLGNCTSIDPLLVGSLLVLYAPRGLVVTSLPSNNSTVSANLGYLQVLWLVVNCATARNELEGGLWQEVASVSSCDSLK